jgi:hypothetical protein
VKLDALKTRMDVQPVFNPCLSDWTGLSEWEKSAQPADIWAWVL